MREGKKSISDLSPSSARRRAKKRKLLTPHATIQRHEYQANQESVHLSPIAEALVKKHHWCGKRERLLLPWAVRAVGGKTLATSEDNVFAVGVKHLTTSKLAGDGGEAAVFNDITDIALDLGKGGVDGVGVLPRSRQLDVLV